MKIYIINLPKSSDRRAFMQEQLDRYGITNYEFIKAFNKDDVTTKMLNYKPWRIQLRKIPENTPYITMRNKGAYAATVSHQMCMQKMLDANERAVILEDDCIINDEFAKVLLEDLPKEIDDGINYLWFGYERHKQPYNEGRKKVFTAYGKQFYMLSNKTRMSAMQAYSPSLDACREILQKNSNIDLSVDSIYAFIDGLEHYMPGKSMASQNFNFVTTITDGRKTPWLRQRPRV